MDGTIPKASVARLPRYLRYLDDLPDAGATVSSEEIAQAAGVTAAQVRKDLSHLGTLGTRGVGYDVEGLRDLIRRQLGLGDPLSVAIMGAGNLGSALANYAGFVERRFRIAGVYDSDPRRIGTEAGPVIVRPPARLLEDAEESGFAIGIVATPPEAAQEVAELLVAADIPAILNFAPVMLRVPEHVTVRQVDLATELQILAYYRRQRRA